MNIDLTQVSGSFWKLGAALAVLAAATTVQAVSIVSVSSGRQDGKPNINLLTEPSCCTYFDDFALHDHGYESPYVPKPSRGYVLFEFDSPVIVHGMTVVQHGNGLTKIEHLAGNSPRSLSSEGASWGSHGDLTGWLAFTEFERDPFAFSGTEAGRFHMFVINKTSYSAGYSTYRWYLDFEAAPVPEPSTWATLVAGALALVGLGARRRRVASSRH